LSSRLWPWIVPDPDDVRVAFDHNRLYFLQAVDARLNQTHRRPSYKFDIDFPQLRLAYGTNSKEVGFIAMAYVVGFLYHLSIYTNHGANEASINKFIEFTGKRVIRIAPDKLLKGKSGCRINDGGDVFEITYDPSNFGEHPFDACKEMGRAIDTADNAKKLKERPTLGKDTAKDKFDTLWDQKKDDVAMHIKEDLGPGFEKIDIVADFNEIWKKMEDGEKNKPDAVSRTNQGWSEPSGVCFTSPHLTPPMLYWCLR